MLKKNLFLIGTLFCAGLLLCAYQWPWDNRPESSPQPPKNQNAGPAVGQSVRPPAAKPMRVEKTQPPAKPAAPKPSAAQASKPAAQKVPVAPVKPAAAQTASAPALPKPSLSPDSVQLRQKLNDIIRVNESVNKLNRARIAQVQVIVGQARVHQRLLNELSVPQDVTTVIKTSDTDQVLMQEKLRAIREESQKNLALNGSRDRKKNSF